MIAFESVSKVYDNGTVALKDVNLHIAPGEFVFVVGASGAGKSTFLKLMMREEVPSHGTIRVGEYVLNDLRKREVPYFRRKLGVVFQDFRLIHTMTVFENVAFAMRVIGAKEKEIRTRVPYVVSLVGLAEKARCFPAELSGGEQQRVALARALANNPQLLIADEPTGNVDPQLSHEIVKLLMRLNNAGTTVLMVTHAHSLVQQFTKRTIILDHGQVVRDGMSLQEEGAPLASTAPNPILTVAPPAQEEPQAAPPPQEPPAAPYVHPAMEYLDGVDLTAYLGADALQKPAPSGISADAKETVDALIKEIASVADAAAVAEKQPPPDVPAPHDNATEAPPSDEPSVPAANDPQDTPSDDETEVTSV